ncbi:MAG: hypothetical protein EAX96_06535 [Candidatus Lokiarchaeota archaeon]|nr:hypothetical protein [Candidatus Lokiarchaeota archaeon]
MIEISKDLDNINLPENITNNDSEIQNLISTARYCMEKNEIEVAAESLQKALDKARQFIDKKNDNLKRSQITQTSNSLIENDQEPEVEEIDRLFKEFENEKQDKNHEEFQIENGSQLAGLFQDISKSKDDSENDIKTPMFNFDKVVKLVFIMFIVSIVIFLVFFGSFFISASSTARFFHFYY